MERTKKNEPIILTTIINEKKIQEQDGTSRKQTTTKRERKKMCGCLCGHEWGMGDIVFTFLFTIPYWIATMIANGTCCPHESASDLPSANGIDSSTLVYAYGGLSIGYVILFLLGYVLTEGDNCYLCLAGTPYFSVLLYFLVAAWDNYHRFQDSQSTARSVLVVLTGIHILGVYAVTALRLVMSTVNWN
jgi:hypothetical protein